MKKQLLLLSNSRLPGYEYLAYALPVLDAFLKPFSARSIASHSALRRALFFPYAGVSIDAPAYTQKVQSALTPLGLQVESAAVFDRVAVEAKMQAIQTADVLLVGGGNTFRLLESMRRLGWLDLVGAAIEAGKPYVGWSAGSVLAGPTICTTNDMPIIDPRGLEALGSVPFQLNCHYTNALPAGLQAETRDERISEYLLLNPERRVLALPEGTWLTVQGNQAKLGGVESAPQAWQFEAAQSGTLAVRRAFDLIDFCA
jgi:dipeptidase E